MAWSTQTFGPDGPWHAVEVNVGTPSVPIALYPGCDFWTHLYSSNVCNNASLGEICYAKAAGVYDAEHSSTSGLGAVSNGASSEGVDPSGGALQLQGSIPNSTMDQFDLGQGRVIPNVSIALHQTIFGTLPDGTAYPLEVGILSLGAPGLINQTFGSGLTANEGNIVQFQPTLINTSMLAGWLYDEIEPNERTASNSWGLHIGSVTPNMAPSLYFGGYDQNRVLGTISSQQGNPIDGLSPNPSEGTIDLVDISINVIEGASPWNFSSMSGLLASGNSSIGTLPLAISGMTPYLYLPKSTCDAIAAQLPVTYQPKYGLYFWNTQDPLYTKIVTSASALTFTFHLDERSSANFTINVPFILLNLTLSQPLTTTPTQYFPCQARASPYQLGRAFLQAAFFGANWNANNDSAAWWLAQAPGPNIPSNPNVVAIGATDATIAGSANEWAASWDGIWTPLPQTANSINATTTPGSNSHPGTTPGSDSHPGTGHASSGISTGVKVGTAIATIVVVGAILGAAFLWWRRKTSREKELEGQNDAYKTRRSDVSVAAFPIPKTPQEMYAENHGRYVRRSRGRSGHSPPNQEIFKELPRSPVEMAAFEEVDGKYGRLELM
jgi:hypothetical protein